MRDSFKLANHAEGTAAYRDLMNMMRGEKLGSGVARNVYVNALNTEQVLKFENAACSFQNIKEWETWRYWRHHEPVARWLAPCIDISPNGVVLIQARCEPLPASYKMPKTLPQFLTDLKRANFGLYKRRLVAVDYGTTIHEFRVKMRRAYWPEGC